LSVLAFVALTAVSAVVRQTLPWRFTGSPPPAPSRDPFEQRDLQAPFKFNAKRGFSGWNGQQTGMNDLTQHFTLR
jgi:hypothetical protein